MSATSRPLCAFAQSDDDVDVDCHAPADVVVEPVPAPGTAATPICLAHLAYIRSESGVTCWRELERLDTPGRRERVDA